MLQVKGARRRTNSWATIERLFLLLVPACEANEFIMKVGHYKKGDVIARFKGNSIAVRPTPAFHAQAYRVYPAAQRAA